MEEITRILDAIQRGDSKAADQLLPLVYEELRRLAACKMARELPGQTLEATALVHEAYIRLVGNGQEQSWDNRGHFFGAAAEAMRRILVEKARKTARRPSRVAFDETVPQEPKPLDDVLTVDEALEKLATEAPEKAQLVKLRYFAGLSLEEASQALGISRATACRHWAYAKAWLYREIREKHDT
ncbi:MAG: sigma-70 family RNA polymerase sigma factor [Pirellulales bacterium]|nr:sigma-70 family RNA polymerase sigma factor [Pirellulales bacterium]